jgi:hypothetical protein
MAGGMGFGQAGMMGMGMQTNGMMGMNAFVTPMQQQQQQMQYLQMMQQHQIAMGGANTAAPGASSAPSAMRIKTEDLVSSLQALLAEHERAGSSRSDASSAAKEAEAKEATRALRSTIEKLEEKNDSLQVTIYIHHRCASFLLVAVPFYNPSRCRRGFAD